MFASGAAQWLYCRVLMRTEIERKGCTSAFMALVSLSSRPIGEGAQTGPLAPVFSHLLGVTIALGARPSASCP